MVHNSQIPIELAYRIHCSIKTTSLNSDPVLVLRENKSFAGLMVGGGENSLLTCSFSDVVVSTYPVSRYHPDHYISLFERFCSPGGDWLNSYTISRSSLDPLKQPHYKAAYNGSYPVKNR